MARRNRCHPIIRSPSCYSLRANARLELLFCTYARTSLKKACQEGDLQHIDLQQKTTASFSLYSPIISPLQGARQRALRAAGAGLLLSCSAVGVAILGSHFSARRAAHGPRSLRLIRSPALHPDTRCAIQALRLGDQSVRARSGWGNLMGNPSIPSPNPRGRTAFRRAGVGLVWSLESLHTRAPPSTDAR